MSFQFPTPDAADRPEKGKVESVRVPCRPVIPKAATRTSAHLQTHTAHLTAPHGTANGTLPEQLPGQQLCDSGVKRVPGHFSEGWQLLQSEAPQPRDRPAAAPARSSPFQSPSPFGLILCSLLLLPFR